MQSLYILLGGDMGSKIKYKRVLIKLSGEALSAGKDGILNISFWRTFALRSRRASTSALR